ncbi:MAG: pantothenate kinase [Candidatus Methanomethylophilaceae archaeon]|nr:pantothenate kinase [Candidatus Methanomethylophilaceae archaeon]
MMVEAFCPGHITCFFRSCRRSGDLLRSGSVGAGLCVDKGAMAQVREGDEDRLTIVYRGREQEAPVTRRALQRMGLNGLMVTISHQLPLGQGMGMSASGTLAACLAAAELKGLSREDAFKAAHCAEIEAGGGLGDVSGLTGHGQSTRIRPGLPPIGEVSSQDWVMELSMVFVGGPLSTAEILQDQNIMQEIDECGQRALDRYLAEPSVDALFRISNSFSRRCGLESGDLKEAMRVVSPFARCGMAMLGNAIFMAGDLDRAEKELGLPTTRVRLDHRGPRVTHIG